MKYIQINEFIYFSLSRHEMLFRICQRVAIWGTIKILFDRLNSLSGVDVSPDKSYMRIRNE